MVRWLLAGAALIAGSLGAAGAFAQHSPSHEGGVAGMVQQVETDAANENAADAPGQVKKQDPGGDTGDTGGDTGDGTTDGATDGSGGDAGGVATIEAAGGGGPCPEEDLSGGETGGDAVAALEEMTHGCAVSTDVHAAQEGTPPGPERGIAVSMAARNADCSMLPEGAQAACEKRAEKPHPNLDGVPGNKPADDTLTGGEEGGEDGGDTTATQSGGGPGNGNGKGKGLGKDK
jgi:hypothetical protein